MSDTGSASTSTSTSASEDDQSSEIRTAEEAAGPESIRTADPASEYAPIRKAGGATVWICEYVGAALPALPTPAMQHALARPEFANANRRLVAVKTPARPREVAALRELSRGHCMGIVQFYDAFNVQGDGDVHLLVEPMEGNAYQLLRSRKGRPLAQGLLADMARQLAGALEFVHGAGWVHGGLCPESVLVTTVGLATWSGLGESDGSGQKDLVAQVKLSGFARASRSSGASGTTTTDEAAAESHPWLQYRAPEGRSSQPAGDLWALGAVLAELTMLKPIFPIKLNTTDEEHWISVRDLVLPDDETAHKLESRFPATLAAADWTECIARLLRYEPDRRIPAGQMLELPICTRPYAKTSIVVGPLV